MNIAIIGNPVTDVSSAKFLTKFCKMITPMAEKVYVINDGIVKFESRKIDVIDATHLARTVKKRKESVFFSLLAFLVAQFGFVIGLLKCIKKVDFIFIFPVAFFLPVIFTKIMGKKTLLYEAQDIFYEYSEKEMAKKIKFFGLLSMRNIVLHLIDYIVVEGKSIIYQNCLQSFRAKIFVCPQFVDGKYQPVKPFRERENVIGFIASIDKRKGAIEFATAVKQLMRDKTHHQFHFVIVGGGPLLDTVHSILKDFIKKRIVQIIEYVPESIFPQLINELKLYVLPSTAEGLPNIILEAMACATPVLATPVGAIPDTINDGETGFIIKNNLPECIAKNIMRALNHHDLEKIAENGRKLIEKEFTFEKAVERWKQLLSSLNH